MSIKKYIDVNRVDALMEKSGYRLTSGVRYESSSQVAGTFTLIPRSVGPLTIAILLKNPILSTGGSIYKC